MLVTCSSPDVASRIESVVAGLTRPILVSTLEQSPARGDTAATRPAGDRAGKTVRPMSFPTADRVKPDMNRHVGVGAAA